MNGPCGRIKKVYHYVNRGVVVVPIMLTMDKATVDGNGRKSPIPVFISFLCIRAHTRHKPWARQLLGYVGKFNKALWPKHDSEGAVLSLTSKQQLKRQVRQDAAAARSQRDGQAPLVSLRSFTVGEKARPATALRA